MLPCMVTVTMHGNELFKLNIVAIGTD